ncbi:MAG: hypothetical protein MJ180_06030, partial [Candidatus Gastranaerophilales bacterium]|nr:hypothetical protein [Candidatus Gastranaerophilales bacterium]
MKKLLSLIIFGFLIFSFNTSIQSVFAEVSTDITAEVANEAPTEIPEASLQTDDVLDKPIFNDKKQQAKKTNNITGKISSFVIKILGFVLLAFVAA